MGKNIYRALLLLLCCTLGLFETLHAAELLYSLPAQQRAAQQFGNAEIAIQLNFLSTARLPLQSEIDFPLVDGIPVSGIIKRIIIGDARPSNIKTKATSVTVIALNDNAGSLELLERNKAIVGMILFDTAHNKLYTADIDSYGRGFFKEQNLNSYLCVEYPSVVAMDTHHIPLVSELTPDLPALQNLESRPGASKTLYINYWGGTLSGTAWNDNYNSGNSIVYTPYSSDTDTTSFSTDDRYLMWLGWRETAEDYAAFNINVTTKTSVYNAAPITSRIQLIATTTNSFYTGAGGVAYVGIFGYSSDYYKTGWAWNAGAGSLGMTLAHESGHQIGLSHDGTSTLGYYRGHGDWGPIMGAPFNQLYVQWSKGEYGDANQQENDLAVITNILGSLTDDAGNSTAAATSLFPPVTNYEGQITPDGVYLDVDVYSFYASGTSHIDIKPLLGNEGENRATNLSLNVNLTNSAGNVIASITSSDNSPLRPTTNTFVYDGDLTAGTYYVTIDAVSPNTNWVTGFGEYGNGGTYRLTVTTATARQQPDLMITSFAVSDAILTPGQTFTASATVKNQGNDSSASTTLRYYRSSNSIISTGDTQISTDSVSALSANGTSARSSSVIAPSTTGTYWIGACVDSVSGESDTGNNCSSGVQITVNVTNKQENSWLLFIPAICGNKIPGSICAPGKVYDCVMACVDSSIAQRWIGDGYCDDGKWGMDLRCPAFQNDGGDCN